MDIFLFYLMSDRSIKKQRLEELEKKISSNVTSASQLLDRSAVLPKPVFASTKINQRQQGSTRVFKAFSKAPQESINPYLQRNTSRHVFKPRPLRFIEPGRFISEAEASRKTARLLALSKSIESRLNEDLGTDFTLLLAKESTPEIEWWDEPMTGGDVTLDSKEFHFPPMQPAAPQPVAELKPVMLTKQESKKLRRQRRLEVQKERREQIRLGLLPPEESKCIRLLILF